MDKTTISNSPTIYLNSDGRRIYPCRCGEVHQGDYAAEDYNHHNCLHETDLWGEPIDEHTLQAICPECGMSWIVDINNAKNTGI